MGDVEQRMVAAGDEIEVNGKKFKLRPVRIQHLCDLEKQSLRYFKKQYLQTFIDGQELMGNGFQDVVTRKMEEIALWDLDDLPRKDAYDVSSIPVNQKVKEWIKDSFDLAPKDDKGCQAVLSNALRTKRITPEEIKEMSGVAPLHGKIRYDTWWVNGCYEGMIEFIYSSVRYEHPELTREELKQWPLLKVVEAASTVDKLSSADLGNI